MRVLDDGLQGQRRRGQYGEDIARRGGPLQADGRRRVGLEAQLEGAVEAQAAVVLDVQLIGTVDARREGNIQDRAIPFEGCRDHVPDGAAALVEGKSAEQIASAERGQERGQIGEGHFRLVLDPGAGQRPVGPGPQQNARPGDGLDGPGPRRQGFWGQARVGGIKEPQLRRGLVVQRHERRRRQDLDVVFGTQRVVGPHLEAEVALHPAGRQPGRQPPHVVRLGADVALVLARRKALGEKQDGRLRRHHAADHPADLEGFIAADAAPRRLDLQLRQARPVVAAERICQPGQRCLNLRWEEETQVDHRGQGGPRGQAGSAQPAGVDDLAEVAAGRSDQGPPHRLALHAGRLAVGLALAAQELHGACQGVVEARVALLDAQRQRQVVGAG